MTTTNSADNWPNRIKKRTVWKVFIFLGSYFWLLIPNSKFSKYWNGFRLWKCQEILDIYTALTRKKKNIKWIFIFTIRTPNSFIKNREIRNEKMKKNSTASNGFLLCNEEMSQKAHIWNLNREMSQNFISKKNQQAQVFISKERKL